MTGLSARELAPGTILEGEVCVVGAGPAGITVATELADAGTEVLLLEEGRPARDHAAMAARRRGRSVGETYYRLEDTRAAGFGGSSLHWPPHFRARPLDATTFEARTDIEHYDGWPLSPDDLDGHYRRAHELCGLDGYDYRPGRWSGPQRPELPLVGDDLRTVMFMLGPPDVWARRLGRVTDHPRITTVFDAGVAELTTGGSGSRVRTAEIRLPGGVRHRARAERFVLAAGGIENPRLLLLSRSGHPAGLGNRDDLVGRFFMEHPHVRAGRIHVHDRALLSRLGLYRPRPADGRLAVQGKLSPSADALRREGILNSTFFLQAVSAPLAGEALRSLTTLRHLADRRPPEPHLVGHVGNLARHPLTALRGLADTFLREGHGEPEVIRLECMAEQRPHPDSRVRLGRSRDPLGRRRPALAWRLSALDRRSIDRAHELIDRAAREAGVGWLEDRLAEASPTPEMYGGRHHLGTTRMAPSPERGVVDPDCRVHGVENLWVAGSSVFPTGGFANPTLTVVAMAVRLAGHLRGGGSAEGG